MKTLDHANFGNANGEEGIGRKRVVGFLDGSCNLDLEEKRGGFCSFI